jgi:CRP/FNR family transcriptional regulator, cyclic AMP receptor protein
MSTVITQLRQADLFDQLTQTQLEMISNLCQEVICSEGQIIFEEYSSCKELYIITQGQVDILVSPGASGTEKNSTSKSNSIIATLRRGQNFGELALVDEGLRSATAKATQKDTRLFVIPREKLLTLCETYPQLGFRLMYNIAADLTMKIRNTDMNIREKLLYTSYNK